MTTFLVEDTINLSLVTKFVTREFVDGFLAAGGIVEDEMLINERISLLSTKVHSFIRLNNEWFRFFEDRYSASLEGF
jgi:hypothetical protein